MRQKFKAVFLRNFHFPTIKRNVLEKKIHSIIHEIIRR